MKINLNLRFYLPGPPYDYESRHISKGLQINFDNLGFLDAHSMHSTRVPLQFVPIKMWPRRLALNPATLWLAAQRHIASARFYYFLLHRSPIKEALSTKLCWKVLSSLLHKWYYTTPSNKVSAAYRTLKSARRDNSWKRFSFCCVHHVVWAFMSFDIYTSIEPATW